MHPAVGDLVDISPGVETKFSLEVFPGYATLAGLFCQPVKLLNLTCFQLDLIKCDTLDLGYAGHGMYSSCRRDIGFDVVTLEGVGDNCRIFLI